DQPIVVPVGVGTLVHDLGFNIVHELDYWQAVPLEALKISLTPCHHWGARFLADLHRGFGGFVIEANGRSIFHCGDSAYFPGFKEIGERHEIEIALLPIGAYDPPSGSGAGLSGIAREKISADALRHLPTRLRAAGRAAHSATSARERGRHSRRRVGHDGRPASGVLGTRES